MLRKGNNKSNEKILKCLEEKNSNEITRNIVKIGLEDKRTMYYLLLIYTLTNFLLLLG